MTRPIFSLGPWRVTKLAGSKKLNVEQADQPHLIVAMVISGMNGLEHAANAALIATAPDLYDFIATLENDDGRIPDWLWQKRNALLAEARGESASRSRPVGE